MGSKIITKTDRQMEDRMLAVAGDPERADTLAKARAFKRTWLELAEALSRCSEKRLWEKWGFSDFDAYCRKELHLRGSTVAKLLGSYRFLETSAPRVIERARTDLYEAPIPSLATVDFVQRATEKGAADEETLQSIHRVAFDEGAEAPVLTRKFGELAFPQTDRDRREKLRAQIAAAARRCRSSSRSRSKRWSASCSRRSRTKEAAARRAARACRSPHRAPATSCRSWCAP